MMSSEVEMRLSMLSADATMALFEREMAGISALSTVMIAAMLATVMMTVAIAFSIGYRGAPRDRLGVSSCLRPMPRSLTSVLCLWRPCLPSLAGAAQAWNRRVLFFL